MGTGRPKSTLFPYTTLFRSGVGLVQVGELAQRAQVAFGLGDGGEPRAGGGIGRQQRSEEHTSELQSRGHLVCRLLLEKKKPNITHTRKKKYLQTRFSQTSNH